MGSRTRDRRIRVAWGAAVGLILGGIPSVWAQQAPPADPKDMSFFDVVWDSLSGHVYAPGRWKPLPFATFFSEGWDEPWAGAPNGQGGEGAPRQGWLNAQDGVFYRLPLLTFRSPPQPPTPPNMPPPPPRSPPRPLSPSPQGRWDIPLILSNKGSTPESHVSSPDLQVVPRFALSETENSAQSLDITFRLPTSDVINNQGEAAVTPYYNFW